MEHDIKKKKKKECEFYDTRQVVVVICFFVKERTTHNGVKRFRSNYKIKKEIDNSKVAEECKRKQRRNIKRVKELRIQK